MSTPDVSPMSYEAQQTPMDLAIIGASQLWCAASTANQFAGFVTTFADGQARFVQGESIANRDSVTVYPDEAGVWQVATTSRRPSIETEGLGKVTEATKVISLCAGKPTSHTVLMGWPSADGSLASVEVVEASIGDPATEATCANLVNAFRAIRGETEQPEADSGRSRLIRWLGRACRAVA